MRSAEAGESASGRECYAKVSLRPRRGLQWGEVSA
jgi:hypothetical protein